MKKIFLLSSLFLLTMVGCAEQVSSTTSSNNSTTSNNTTSVETTTSETTTSIDQALINAKNEAKKALQDFVEEQIIQDKTQLNNLLTSLLLKIDEASSIEQVNTEKENGLTLLQELANTLNTATTKLSKIDELRKERGIYQIKPGITGWAQVHGRDLVTNEQKANLDEYYLRHMSLWLDIKIFFLTIKKIFKRSDIKEGSIEETANVDSMEAKVNE